MQRKRLGVVTDGAFNAGLTVRLDPGCSTEDLRIGSFVIVEGEHNRYFSMISDMQLRATDARLLADPPRDASPFIARALVGTNTYATVQVKPMLMLEKVGAYEFAAETSGVQPVRTIPMHFAELCEADEMDFATVFGREGGMNFAMGTPLTMDIPICLNLERLVERSSGIFGQSGTGKSMLARILLSGVVKAKAAVNLVFDMHSEYAFDKQTEDGTWVKGLRQIFGSQVMVYTLDEKSAARAGRQVDVVLRIGLNQIETEDVMLLAEELDLTPTARATVGLLQDTYGADWLRKLLAMSTADIAAFCQEKVAHQGATEALQRKLRDVGRLAYVMDEAPFSVIDEMVAALDKGKHIVLQFGRHNRPLDYMLVANIVTRRIRRKYQEKVERYEETRDPSDQPRPLMITIEEAHKFLNPTVARQTIFGQIARELRKYNVTLMVIDQRPSGIDGEVMSQLGTRVSGKLTEERDIEAVLTGVGGRSFLRGALESLDTRQQILVMGHAVPMPIQVRTRQYDEEFYKAMGAREGRKSAAADIADLFGE
jgi:DNA helicase HerA-like ATPase